MFTCDVCGREVDSCHTFHGLKLCFKCSPETFCKNMLPQRNSELLVNSLAEKDKQIVELKKQLEEKEKELKEIRVENYTIKSYRDFLNNQCKNLIKENKKLNRQLKSQPAEIVEKIKGIAIIDVEEYSNDPILYKITEEGLDTILKDYQK